MPIKCLRIAAAVAFNAEVASKMFLVTWISDSCSLSGVPGQILSIDAHVYRFIYNAALWSCTVSSCRSQTGCAHHLPSPPLSQFLECDNYTYPRPLTYHLLKESVLCTLDDEVWCWASLEGIPGEGVVRSMEMLRDLQLCGMPSMIATQSGIINWCTTVQFIPFLWWYTFHLYSWIAVVYWYCHQLVVHQLRESNHRAAAGSSRVDFGRPLVYSLQIRSTCWLGLAL